MQTGMDCSILANIARSIPANVGMPPTRRCTHISIKATTCRIQILGITWGVSQEEKEKNHSCRQQVNKQRSWN